MSDQNDAASRTEEPTPRKLQQARERGEVVKTPDLSALASLAAAASVVIFAGGALANNLMAQLTPFFAHPDAMRLRDGDGIGVAKLAIMAALPAVLAVLGAAAAAGVGSNLLQTGLMFTPEKLAPDFSRLSLGAGLKRVFGLDGFAQFVKSLVKVFITGVIAWSVIQPHMPELEHLSEQDPVTMLVFSLDLIRRLVFAVGGFLLVVAGGDYMWQRQRFMARMRMTKEEMKEDYKQSEGDPHIKARQKALRIQRAKRRMIQAIPTATVVVMNPTHYAVALKYDTSEAPAPLCVAKGMDSLALKIRAVAEQHGVPVIEDPPLARALYASVEVDDIIPPTHYQAVAKIIGIILGAGRKAVARRHT